MAEPQERVQLRDKLDGEIAALDVKIDAALARWEQAQDERGKELYHMLSSQLMEQKQQLLLERKEVAGTSSVAPDCTSGFVRRMFDGMGLDAVPPLAELGLFLSNDPEGFRLPVHDSLYQRLIMMDQRLASRIEPASRSSAWRLATHVSEALERDMESTGEETTLAGYIDFLLFDVMAIVEKALEEHGLKRKRNSAESSLTLRTLRPDQIVTISGALLFKGEDKANSCQLDDAVLELRNKMANRSAIFHGKIEYLLSYAAAGNLLLLCGLERGNKDVIHRLTPQYDMNTVHGRLSIMGTAIRTYAVMLQQAKQLPAKYPLTGIEQFRPGGTVVMFMGTFVEKRVTASEQPGWYDAARVGELSKVYKVASRSPHIVHTTANTMPSFKEGIYTVRVEPVGVQLGSEFHDNMPKDEPELRLAIRCVLSALKTLHGAGSQPGWGHGDLRWENVIKDGMSYVLIDLETVIPLGKKPRRRPFPAIWGDAGSDVLVAGKYTAQSDLFLVGRLMQSARVELSMLGCELMEALLAKRLSLSAAMAHQWFQ